MFLRTSVAALTPLFHALRSAPVAAMSTGTFVVSQPLNYRGGARVEPADSSGIEKAFEPATGNGTETETGGRAGTAGRGRGRPGEWRGRARLELPASAVRSFSCPEPSCSAFSRRLLNTDKGPCKV